MTDILEREADAPDSPVPPQPYGEPSPDRPNRRARISASTATDVIATGLASFALMWTIFTLAGVDAPFGLGVAAVLTFFLMYGFLCWRRYGVMAMKDRLATVGIWGAALLALVPLAAVILYVIIHGAAVVFAHFPHFFFADFSQYTATAPVTAVGAGAAIVGTIEQVGIATMISVPLGVMTATYLVDNRNLFARIVESVVDAMTGSPAIIAGLFVYLIWVVPNKELGKTGFAAALALSVMMIPIVTRAAYEVIVIVPGSLREAALALGAPRWKVVLRVILPTARVGIVTAAILGVARVAGETAPVLFVAGGNAHYNWNPFSGQQDDLPIRIYFQIFQPGTNAIRDAWGVSMVLIMVVLTLFLLARLIGSAKPGGGIRLWGSIRQARRENES